MDNRVKTETFCFSIKVMGFAIRYPSSSQSILLFHVREDFRKKIRFLTITAKCRAFLKEHSEAGTFVDQYIAAGAYSQRLAQIYENYYGLDK